ncbi:hypothetical protein [uncultured Eubacterium sp.]|uniref:hypothetical protein n=1 Tax=uncultured Eubacterium sp. TaxID=165185 RepID=UPI002608E42A|nr:hypothetical protein [uncultured Eubacterium sp.]
MSEFNSNDINDAKRRVEEMRKKANNYIDTPQNEDKIYKNSSAKSDNKNNSPLSFLSDLTGSLFSSSGNDGSQGLILALILILSKEGADSKLILALLYILL